jgi:hypothetical protein
MEREEEDLAWLKSQLPPAPGPGDPLVRRTVAGARERARHQGRRAPWALWLALALGTAGVLVGVAVGVGRGGPVQAPVGVVAWVVDQPSELDWDEAEVALVGEDRLAAREVEVPEVPGMIEVDEDDLTDEELAAVADRLRMRS